MKQSLFSSRAVILLIACATALAAASTLLHARGITPGRRFSAEANSHSISAIGHAGFYDLLRRLGRPVSRNAGNVPPSTLARGTIIAAEPNIRYLQSANERLAGVSRLLLVLPKWSGTPDTHWPSWIYSVETVPLDRVNQVLTFVTEGRGSVSRRHVDSGEMAWQVNSIGINPTLPNIVQLVQSKEIKPLVGGNDGILLGEIEISGRQIWVLSDPDVLSNHGIVMGDNAAFMLTVIDTLRRWNNSDPEALIVFDGILHGFQEQRPSPLALLFGFPFVIVTILTCIAALLLVLSGTSRFGAPLVSKPALDFGKANLIGNGARLLDYAGHHSEVLVRYIGMTLNHVVSVLRAPDGDMAASEWLDRVGRSRGVKASCANFFRIYQASHKSTGREHSYSQSSLPKSSLHKSSPRELDDLFENAKKIYDWKQEILKGENVTHGYSNKPASRF